MDIAALSMDFKSADILNKIGFAMMKKSLDTVEELGDGMIKMMEQSVHPELGQNIDVTV